MSSLLKKIILANIAPSPPKNAYKKHQKMGKNN
jgi:hypothetical protein